MQLQFDTLFYHNHQNQYTSIGAIYETNEKKNVCILLYLYKKFAILVILSQFYIL